MFGLKLFPKKDSLNRQKDQYLLNVKYYRLGQGVPDIQSEVMGRLGREACVRHTKPTSNPTYSGHDGPG